MKLQLLSFTVVETALDPTQKAQNNQTTGDSRREAAPVCRSRLIERCGHQLTERSWTKQRSLSHRPTCRPPNPRTRGEQKLEPKPERGGPTSRRLNPVTRLLFSLSSTIHLPPTSTIRCPPRCTLPLQKQFSPTLQKKTIPPHRAQLIPVPLDASALFAPHLSRLHHPSPLPPRSATTLLATLVHARRRQHHRRRAPPSTSSSLVTLSIVHNGFQGTAANPVLHRSTSNG